MGAIGAGQPRYRTVEDKMVNPNLIKGSFVNSVRKNLSYGKNWRETALRKRE